MSSMIEKVAALLALAENNSSEHEAELALMQAQKLATLNAIDLAVARQHTAKKEKREEIEARVFQIGQRGSRSNKQFVELFLAIARQNDVHCTIAMNSTCVYPMGFPSDLDVVEAMYQSLAVQMVRASTAYLKKGDYKLEIEERRVRKTDSWGYSYYEWEEKPLDGRQARSEFNRGFIRRIEARLAEARRTAQEQAEEVKLTVDDETTGEVTQSTGALVLASKSEESYKAHRDRLKREKIRGSWKGSRSSVTSYGSRNAGSEAGANAKLRGETAIGGGRREVAS